MNGHWFCYNCNDVVFIHGEYSGLQACPVLRRYRRQGWIVANQINREKPHRDNSGKVRISEVRKILFFFSEAGPLQLFCDFFKMEISPQQIRQQLQLV